MTHQKRFLAIALLAGWVLAPGPVAAQSYPPIVTQMVAAAKKQVKTIDMAQFKAAYDKKEVGLLVDVRDPDEYAEGHIPGAVNVSRGLLEFRIWSHVGYPDKTDMNKQMTLYCRTGGRCALAAKTLQELGFTNVVAADIRIEEWVKAGYPMVKPKQ
ncbi:MAG: rhodanese-like domain-containing protein [Burkholderiaceae bacterium]|nr:rhodanese-like domain-containing protein [Burkholderiaceae bacterium]